MRTRAFSLVSVTALVLLVAACGRATDAEIDQALGITPTATASAAQLATGTARAAAAATQAAVAAAGGSPGAEVAAVGDVTRGSRQFTVSCMGCHRAGGAGPDLLAPGGPGAAASAATLLPLLREGVGHAVPPGPYTATELSDATIANLAAYIQSRAAP